jgi:L-amino acid N-acyltransferase YncA
MEVRRAQSEDLAGVVDLQDRNLYQNVSEKERGGGFLSNRFSEEQFAAINADVSVVVALEDSRVVGFLCGSDMKAMADNPLVKSMISADSGALSFETTCLGGPVCVDESQRGKGVMAKLYDSLVSQLHGTRYKDIAVFISDVNVASIKAHEKVGFAVVNTFKHADKTYLTLVKAAAIT